jgi:hypothetical protein
MKQDDDRIKDLYRQSATEQPPAHLDEAILAASRKEALSEEQRPAAPFSGRWQLPVSIAAVVMVTVLLVPLLQEEQHEEERYDTATPVPSTVTPYETDLSVPSAVIQQEVAVPRKQKALMRPEAVPAREESEKAEDVQLTDSIGDTVMSGEPDQWLNRIEALIDTGDETDALAELKKFKRRYPAYPLPPALEALRKKDK